MLRISPYGTEASLVDGLMPGTAVPICEEFLRQARASGIGVVDVVPAATSVVVTHAAHEAATVRRLLADAVQHVTSASNTDGYIPSDRARRVLEPVVEIPVRYDGADVEEVANHCGMSPADVITLHAGATYVVEFCGFSPGFAYLTGLPERLRLPRRSSPRPRVTAGSVAIAAGYSAVYPRDSPGGWHLLGTTSLTMWDASRVAPALLRPGMVVRFVREA